MIEFFLQFLPILLIFIISDFLISFNIRKQSARWYALHVLTNAVVCYFTFSDMINLLQNPLVKSSGDAHSTVPRNVILVSHAYHVLMFSNVQMIDYIHHGVMSFVLAYTYFFPVEHLMNYTLFFANGLPGGMDYILLLLVHFGVIHKNTEKQLNSYINICIRSPFIIIGAYIIHLNYNHNFEHTFISSFAVYTEILTLYWNSQYFTYRVIKNYGEIRT